MEACGPTRHTFYVLDTNVLIHDPNALLNFEEHHVIIPMTVLEELDKLKSGKTSIAADCRQATCRVSIPRYAWHWCPRTSTCG